MESPIRTLIVDDESTAQEMLAEYVGRHAGLEAVGTCDSAVEAANTLRETAVDLLLSGVEMPEMSGLQLVKAMESPPAFVLVTGSEEYAVEAFELAAVDYLVKPLRYARFLEAIRRVEGGSGAGARAADPGGQPPDGRDGSGGDEEAESLPADPARPSGQNADPSANGVLFVKEGDALVPVSLANIQYVEAKGDYMLVQTTSGQHVVKTTMAKIEEQLPSRMFVRVHRSYLVRIDQIERIEKDWLLMGGAQVSLGPTYRETFLERIWSL